MREEWYPDPESHIMAEDLFEGAIASAECRYAQDIPEMREVVALLDRAIESDSNEACFQLLEKSMERFNGFIKRFHSNHI